MGWAVAMAAGHQGQLILYTRLLSQKELCSVARGPALLLCLLPSAPVQRPGLLPHPAWV